MKCTELMVEEHEKIKRMLAVVRKLCTKILNGQQVQYEDFYIVIDFIRNYADKHHHGKEEALLFNRMVEELGETAEKLVNYGMLAEHELGRLYVSELEVAVKKVLSGDQEARLDVIANAMGYVNLLHRHIEKEDMVVYKFAENQLQKSTQQQLDDECGDYEANALDQDIQKKYEALLAELEKKINL